MQELNQSPILDQTREGNKREMLIVAALWKLSGGTSVKLTAQDIQAFVDAYGGSPVLFMHGHADSIELGFVGMAEAMQLAAHQSSMTSGQVH